MIVPEENVISHRDEFAPISPSLTAAHEMQEAQRTRLPTVPLALICFSLFYFSDVLLRASEKYFWYDELFTLYLSRLDLHSLWQALRAGADFNPPLIYLLTKSSQALFGEGRISTRLPEIIAFWVFCLSLFRVVSRRVGKVAGFIAMLLPLFTGAFYYAYEARPHALVLAFAGLSFVCWQMSKDGQRRGLWLALFALSLFCAFMGHCYAVVIAFPFAVAELFETVKNRRLDYSTWAGIGAPLALAIPIYLPLLHSAHNGIGGTQFNSIFPSSWNQIPDYYRFLLSPCLTILLLALLLLCLSHLAKATVPPALPIGDLLVAIGFLALPALGVILGKAVAGPFFPRYFLSSLLGVCFLLAIAFAPSPTARRNWVGVSFMAVLVCLLGSSYYHLVAHRLHHAGEILVEPSSGRNLDTTPWNPMANESFLLSATKEPIPIALGDPLVFLHLAHYSPAFAGRVYFVAFAGNDFFQRGFGTWSRWGPKYNPPERFSEFISSHHDFYLYGGPEVIWEVSDLTSKGWTLRSLQSSGSNNLAWLEHSSKLQD